MGDTTDCLLGLVLRDKVDSGYVILNSAAVSRPSSIHGESLGLKGSYLGM